MTRLLLLRHGDTDAVGQTLAARAPGVHLNAEGRRQVAALADALAGEAPAALVASPMERTRETAAALAGRWRLEVQTDPDLTELDAGEWTGRTFADLDRDPAWQSYNGNRLASAPPGGEHPAAIQARMAAALRRLALRYPGESVAVVSHADPLRAAIGWYMGLSMQQMLAVDIDPASLSILVLEPQRTRLACLNRVFH